MLMFTGGAGGLNMGISALNPTPSYPHSLPNPSTGAWWTNLALADGNLPVVPLPYAVKVLLLARHPLPTLQPRNPSRVHCLEHLFQTSGGETGINL